MKKRLSIDARGAVLEAATTEAARRGDDYIGSEHLLLATLARPEGVAAAALGTDLAAARRGLALLDEQALAGLGIEVDIARFDPHDRPRSTSRPRFTSGAKHVLHRAVIEAKREDATVITTRHLLLGVLGAEPPDAAVTLLGHLRCDLDAARATLAPSGVEAE